MRVLLVSATTAVALTLATAASVDVTADVITALNAVLPSIQTTAPAAPANTTQGR